MIGGILPVLILGLGWFVACAVGDDASNERARSAIAGSLLAGFVYMAAVAHREGNTFTAAIGVAATALYAMWTLRAVLDRLSARPPRPQRSTSRPVS